MTSYEVKQKQNWMEDFNSVVALFYELNASRISLRPTRAISQDAANALRGVTVIGQHALDFVLDIEIKTKRMLGDPLYELFLRTVINEQTEILPEYMRESLGRLWKENSLTTDGNYSQLFYETKNRQDRSCLKSKGDDTQNVVGEEIEPYANTTGF